MAEETKKKVVKEVVTAEQFKSLEGSVTTLAGLVTDMLKAQRETQAKDPAEVAKEKEVTKAGPAVYIAPVNPEWEQMAYDIIGKEKVERCEMQHGRTGGLTFTVVIKKEYSNAPDAYLAIYKEDKRSKEIGAEGITGVENWCKLIAQNLKRGKTYVAQ